MWPTEHTARVCLTCLPVLSSNHWFFQLPLNEKRWSKCWPSSAAVSLTDDSELLSHDMTCRLLWFCNVYHLILAAHIMSITAVTDMTLMSTTVFKISDSHSSLHVFTLPPCSTPVKIIAQKHSFLKWPQMHHKTFCLAHLLLKFQLTQRKCNKFLLELVTVPHLLTYIHRYTQFTLDFMYTFLYFIPLLFCLYLLYGSIMNIYH